jgi:Protein of unknown function (DUF4240)
MKPTSKTQVDFWQLVATANKDFELFCTKLKSMSKGELEEFVWKFSDLAEVCADDEYLSGILAESEGMSEDSLEDLFGWIVGKGEEFYKKILKNPDQVPKAINDDTPGIAIQYEASKIYHEKFGGHIPEQ